MPPLFTSVYILLLATMTVSRVSIVHAAHRLIIITTICVVWRLLPVDKEIQSTKLKERGERWRFSLIMLRIDLCAV